MTENQDQSQGDTSLADPAHFAGVVLPTIGRLQNALGRTRVCIEYLSERTGEHEKALLADARALEERLVSLLSETLAGSRGSGVAQVGVEALGAPEGAQCHWCYSGRTDCPRHARAVDISTGSE